ncbi:MAG: hypothetical protein Q9216_006717, partial [Gyalolechia sp. 2 TL-2023]
MAAVDDIQKDSFSYKDQLKPRNIRLLKLLPAGSRSDDIHCTIDQACLDDKIQYEALSYTWGDATERSELYCNGKHLSITSNLGQALPYLRSSEETRTLWIDAVCINQADNGEKSHQIALMGDVYTKAHQVIAWIGEENPADASAMDFGDPNPLPDNSPPRERVLKLMGLQAKLSGSLISARALIQRPWFGRAWIIQEAALAERLQIQCGEKVIDWESLFSNLRLMSQTDDANGTPLTFGNIFYQRLEFIDATRNSIKFARSGERKLSDSQRQVRSSVPGLLWKELHSAVNNGRLYGASNPQDHIYALLGLVDENAAKSLLVDYSQSYSTIYRSFVRHIIQKTRTLTALGQIDSEATPDLASWVPNYARAPMVEPLCSDDKPVYTASGDSEARLLDSNNNASILALSGIFIDTVDDTAPGPSTDKEKVFTRSERLVHRSVEKVHPTELLPKLASKAVGHYFPKSKEIFDGAHKEIRNEEHQQLSNQAVSDGPNRHLKRSLDFFAPFSSGDREALKESMGKQATNLFASYVKDMRSVRQNYLFGPMHPTAANVYMKPALEEQWQRLAQKCHPYPTGEDLEDVYWRTLIGNRRSDATGGAVDKAPAVWKDAYKIWHEQLWEKEGMIPKFLNGRGLNLKEGLSSWGGMSRPESTKEHNKQPISEDLSRYVADVIAKQNRDGFDEQFKALSMRQIMGLAISLSIDERDIGATKDPKEKLGKEIMAYGLPPQERTTITPSTEPSTHAQHPPNVAPTDRAKVPGFSPLLPQESIKQLSNWINTYPEISPSEKARLRETFAADPSSSSPSSATHNNNNNKDLTPATARAKIDQAFKYDFLRISRNRKFCTTKRGYM